MNEKAPYLSWKQNSCLKTIEDSCKEMVQILRNYPLNTFYIPLAGCGNGKLNKEDVLPILEKYFNNFENIYLVEE